MEGGPWVDMDLNSRVTDAVLEEAGSGRTDRSARSIRWCFLTLGVKIRDEGLIKNTAVYVALALNPAGEKQVVGLWIEQSESAKFWSKWSMSSKRAASTIS